MLINPKVLAISFAIFLTPYMISTNETIIASISQEYLGEYTITAYCSCEICCGKWATNRPDGIVYGAGGVPLHTGHCASPLPFGTHVEIEGLGGYEVQDRTADWIVSRYSGRVIDIYFDEHGQALEFGKQIKRVWRVGE